jgi:hypothetical protein
LHVLVIFDADDALLYPLLVILGTLAYLAWCIRQSYKECYDDLSCDLDGGDESDLGTNTRPPSGASEETIPLAVRRRAAAIAKSNK